METLMENAWDNAGAISASALPAWALTEVMAALGMDAVSSQFMQIKSNQQPLGTMAAPHQCLGVQIQQRNGCGRWV